MFYGIKFVNFKLKKTMKIAKNYLLLFCCLSLHFCLLAQNNFSTLILSSADSSRIIISNGREKILKNIQAGKGDENINLINEMRSLVDTNKYVTLFFDEEQIIGFLSGNKTVFLNSLKEKDWVLDRELPAEDSLFDRCKLLLKENIVYWRNWIAEQEMAAEEHLLYDLYLSQMDMGIEKQEAFIQAKEYIRKNEESEFIPFVKSIKSDFRTASLGVSLSGGNVYLNGPASTNVNVGGLLAFEIDYVIQRIYCSMYFQSSITGNSLVEYSGNDSYNTYQVYEKGNYANHFTFGVKGGLMLYQSNSLKIYPFGLISLSNLSVSHSNSEIDSYNIATGLGLGGGLGIDVPVFSWKGTDIELGEEVDHHLGLRFNVGVETVLAGKKQSSFSDMFMHAGIVWWMGDL